MENQRLFLIIGLVFLGLLLFQQWQKDYGQPKTASTPQVQSTDIPGAAPSGSGPTTAAIPQASTIPADVPTAPQASSTSGPVVVNGEGNKLPVAQRVHIVTDVLDVELDTFGGDIRQVDLKKYPVSIEKKDVPTRLMTDTGARLFVAQSGFSMVEGQGPNHESIYQVTQNEYRLAEGKDEVKVDMTWTGQDGTQVIKTYTFHRGSYLIDMNYKVVNRSVTDWKGSFYRQMQRTHYGEDHKLGFVYTYMGGVIYTPQDHFEKIKFEAMQKKNLDRQNIHGGWVAMMQHYFLGAWIPDQDKVNNFFSKYLNLRYYIGMISPVETVAAGSSKDFHSEYYVGPKVQSVLEKIAPGLELTNDYGFLTVIAKPIFWLLQHIHSLIGNWGWSIIFLTVLIKLAFFKLSETSYRSMANMRKLQPRMKALKERYGDDKQKMNAALMEMYKTEKINPLGGCLPILVQIPVFISLYWVLLEAVELRQAPFMLWIQDLATQDPYYVLPLLMGATMFLQQRLNPAPLDPVQAKVMMFLPVIFTVFFLFFPAGLVLYWVVNNSLSITQQWVITRRVEAGTGKK